MRIARRQLGIGIADADNWSSIECIVGQPLVAHPTSVDEHITTKTSKPRLRAHPAGCAIFFCSHFKGAPVNQPVLGDAARYEPAAAAVNAWGVERFNGWRLAVAG